MDYISVGGWGYRTSLIPFGHKSILCYPFLLVSLSVSLSVDNVLCVHIKLQCELPVWGIFNMCTDADACNCT